ncbi:MAG: hypothetical protein IT195_12395 [Microthrixaceae bacterium]|nr:hypothetical protein [Microthrixaceae bacterium]
MTPTKAAIHQRVREAAARHQCCDPTDCDTAALLNHLETLETSHRNAMRQIAMRLLAKP